MKYYLQYYNTKSIGRDEFMFKCCPSITTKMDRNSSIPPKDIFEEIYRKGEDFVKNIKTKIHGLFESNIEYEYTAEASTPPEVHTDKLDLRGMTFIHASHRPDSPPTENSCLMMNGKKYRVRVETLIYNDKGEIYAAKRDKPTSFGAFYKIPGGSAEPGKTLEQQAIAESQEEVRANVKNIKFTGIWYINEFDDSDNSRLGVDTVSWLKKVGLKYDGFITVLFVAKYAGKFNGHIKKVDQVDWIKDVKFHDPKDLNLIEPHKMALQKVWFNTNSLSK
jgi:ADP-ribose pyrophosphatase YjhB (NUDIX family)